MSLDRYIYKYSCLGILKECSISHYVGGIAHNAITAWVGFLKEKSLELEVSG